MASKKTIRTDDGTLVNVRRTITKKLRFQILGRDKFTCQYCGRSAPDVVLEIEHVHPASCLGSSKADNLVAACWDCNRGKSAMIARAMWHQEFLGYGLSSDSTLTLMCLAVRGGLVVEHDYLIASHLGLTPIRLRSAIDDLKDAGFADYRRRKTQLEIWTWLPRSGAEFPWNGEDGRRRLRGEEDRP